jgi:hypothetical protein
MRYTVISGDFRTVIESSSPREAAEEALSLWKLKSQKPNLAKITMVVKPDNKEIYLPTENLMATAG